MKNIYIQRKGAMGDVLLTTPIVHKIKQDNKSANIIFMTNSLEVYKNNPDVYEIIKPTKNISGEFINLDLVYENNPKMYIVDAYAKHVFGDSNIDKTLRFYTTKDDKSKVNRLINDNNITNFIVIHMTTSWENRTMSLDNWKIIINKLLNKGYKIVIVGHGSDLDYSYKNVYSFKGRLSIHEIKELIELSDGFIGMDSGLLHIATTTNTKTIGIFTCAKSEYRIPKKDNIIPIHTNLDCYGCLHEQNPPVTFVKCKYGHNKCVETINYNEIVDNFEYIDNQKILYDIIIPSWNMSHVAIPCLESIKKYSKNYRVIFVDNGSDEEEFNKIFEVLETMPHLLIRNTENLGFIKATNAGLSASTAPYVVLMNNDTEAVKGWLDKLVQPLEEVPSAGLSGPLTTTPNSWQGTYPKDKTGYVLRSSGMLAFFCTMIKRSVIDTIGLLDEQYGVGFGDDDDYCHRARGAGFHLALVQDLIIPHHHRSTFKQIYNDDTIIDMQTKAINKFKEQISIQAKNKRNKYANESREQRRTRREKERKEREARYKS